ETARRVALGIEIDEQDPLLCHGERGGHVHCRGGLADAALLVRDRENRPQGHPPHLIPASRPRITECSRRTTGDRPRANALRVPRGTRRFRRSNLLVDCEATFGL